MAGARGCDRRPKSRDEPGQEHPRAGHGSCAQDPQPDDVFQWFCQGHSGVCLFSVVGLCWLKERADAAKVIEKAIGGPLPERVPSGCKGSVDKTPTGLLAHVSAKMCRPAAQLGREDSDSEDEDEACIQVGHSQFHAYLERRISPEVRLQQAQRMLQGQNKEHNAKVQKMQAAGAQERQAQERRHEGELREAAQLRERKERQNSEEHERSLAALRERQVALEAAMREEFGVGALETLRLTRALALAEGEKALAQAELDFVRRGLEAQAKMPAEEQAKAKALKEGPDANPSATPATGRETEHAGVVQTQAASQQRVAELKTKLARMVEKCAQLSADKEDLQDLHSPLLLQNDILQSKLDAFFLVGSCLGEFASDTGLVTAGKTAMVALRLNARGETQAARQAMGSTVRAFLESPAVQLAHVQHVAASLTLEARPPPGASVGDLRQPIIDLIMREKFS